MARTPWPITGIFLCLSVFFLDWASGFLIPTTAALLGYFIAMPIERRMSKFGVPSALTAALICFCVAIVLFFVMMSVVVPLADLMNDLPRMLSRLRYDLIGAGGGTIEQLQKAADAAAEALDEGSQNTVEVRVKGDTGIVMQIAAVAPALGGQVLLTLVLMFFLIASGRSFVRKLVSVIPTLSDKRTAVIIVNQVTDKLGIYLGGITLINAALGFCIGMVTWAMGLPNPLLFAFIGFAFNFIPYLGAIAGATLVFLVAYSAHSDVWFAFAAFGAYMALSGVEGQIVTPYIISGRLKLNPTVVFVTVAFFAWIWSVIGMVVAVPILISAKIILDELESTRAIGLFLGGEDETLDDAPETKESTG